MCGTCREIFDCAFIKEEKKMSICPVCGREEYEEGKDIEIEEDTEGEEYIYEKLSPGEILIISRDEDSFLVAENKDGNVQIREIDIE